MRNLLFVNVWNKIVQKKQFCLFLCSLWNLKLTCRSHSFFKPHFSKQTLSSRGKIQMTVEEDISTAFRRRTSKNHWNIWSELLSQKKIKNRLLSGNLIRIYYNITTTLSRLWNIFFIRLSKSVSAAFIQWFPFSMIFSFWISRSIYCSVSTNFNALFIRSFLIRFVSFRVNSNSCFQSRLYNPIPWSFTTQEDLFRLCLKKKEE